MGKGASNRPVQMLSLQMIFLCLLRGKYTMYLYVYKQINRNIGCLLEEIFILSLFV